MAGGVSQTPSYLSCKSEMEVKKIFHQQLEVFMKKNVDFLIAEVSEEEDPLRQSPSLRSQALHRVASNLDQEQQ